jgi:hypothetical protein
MNGESTAGDISIWAQIRGPSLFCFLTMKGDIEQIHFALDHNSNLNLNEELVWQSARGYKESASSERFEKKNILGK